MKYSFTAGDRKRYYPTLTLSLTPDEIGNLREMARELGFLIGRGILANDGSIQQLIKSIAAGYVVCVPYDKWYTRDEKENQDEQ